MHIGAFRQRLDLEYQTVVGSTNTGHFEGRLVWLPWKKNISCEISVRRGQEHFMRTGDASEGQRYGKDVWFFRVRQGSVRGIDSKMRVLHKGLVFDIRHIRPDGQYGREMTLECEVQDAVIGSAPMVPAVEEMIPVGIKGKPYDGFSIAANGGEEPYLFIPQGTFPPGLVVDEDTGAVSGTPLEAGTWNCEVRVFDCSGGGVPITFQIIVDEDDA